MSSDMRVHTMEPRREYCHRRKRKGRREKKERKARKGETEEDGRRKTKKTNIHKQLGGSGRYSYVG